MPTAEDVRTVPAAVQRLRLACVALGLTLLTFAQSSGFEAADTKLDLVVAPARFLRKALTMWDPTAAAGQLQDQAYGYLFPMGPFFLLGKLSALSPWVVQRSWESLLLIAGFLGVVRLSRLLGVPGFWPRVGAGLAYTLAPRMLMELGVISSELLPVVALPWVLIPLVHGASDGSPRRAAARSGVALLFASGINAAATLAILPVPALWLLTRSRSPRRRALMSWWALFVLLACLWWVVPLVVLGAYSPPFLDWIESSAVTTSRTSLIAALRGVDHWQAYLGPNVWPAGWILAVAPAAILATTAVAASGLAGLARRSTPHRVFLTATLVMGLVLVTLGHVSTIGPPFAGSVRDLLDTTLVAFRNVHKFDPVLRLPIAIGSGHALATIGRRVPARRTLRARGLPAVIYPRALVAVAVVGIAATAITPALAGRIVPQTRSANVPSWWKQAGAWLGRHEGAGRALVVPGAAQPSYIWGDPRDDALQPVAKGPWTVRDAAPLTQPGYVRLLDTIESILAGGGADASLAPLLARSGIRYLIVRNDLDTRGSRATALRYVHATIANSPGLSQVATFGPDLTAPDDPDRLVDLGLTKADGAVAVYENTDWNSEVTLLPATGTVLSNGSSEELPDLIATGISADTPVIFGPEPSALQDAGTATTTVLTDGTRRREFGFGGINNYSATMTAGQPYRAERAVHDYLPSGSTALSTAEYSGISDVRASSSAAVAESAWAALDNNADTAWVSASVSGAVGQWLQVDLPKPVTLPSVVITFAAGRSEYPTRLRVTTDAGSIDDEVSPDSNRQTIELPSGQTGSIRLAVAEMSSGGAGTAVAIQSMTIRGVLPSRTLAVPGVQDADIVAFSVLRGARPPCLTVSGAAACDPSWAAAGEEDGALDRVFRTATADEYRAEVDVRLQPGAVLDNLLDAGNPVQALASSVDSADPRERPGAAVDGDATTGWVAKAGTPLPSIELTTAKAHRIEGIQLAPIEAAPVTVPTRVLITIGSMSFIADVPTDGRIQLPQPEVSDSVRVAVLGSSLRVSTDSVTAQRRLLPVGIGEIRLLGRDAPEGRAAGVVRVACGAGQPLLLNGAELQLQVAAPASAVLSGTAVAARPCGSDDVRLLAGVNRIRVAATTLMSPEDITLRRSTVPSVASEASGVLDVSRWSDIRRDVHVVTTAQSFLSVAENANAGWSASLDGKRLVAVTLDGWHQGWLVPAGANGVIHLVFRPQRIVDWGWVFGALAVLLLVACAFGPVRRRPVAGAAVEGTLRASRLIVLGAVAVAAVGGFVGVAVLVFALLARSLRIRTWVRLVPLALIVAGAGEAIRPSNSTGALADSRGVQLLCLVSVVVLVVALLPSPAPRPTVFAQQGPLEQVVRGGGSGGSGERGESEQRGEVAAKEGPMRSVLDEDQ